jgi:ATP-dependent Clp protease protease subunit
MKESDTLRDMMEYGVNVSARQVFLQTGIGPEEGERYNATEHVVRSLLYLDRVAYSAPIFLWINSEGGDVDDALAIYDVMQTLNTTVHTIAHGLVASAAGLILAGGDVRIAMPNSWFMAHQLRCGVEDVSPELMRTRTEQLERQAKQWARLMSDCTKHRAKWWEKKLATGDEWYLSPREMKRHGIVDKIWGEE